MVRAIAFIVLATLSLPLSAQNIPVYIQKPIAPTYSSLPPATLAALGVSEVEDYGPFVIAQLPESASGTFAARAAASGLAGRLAPEFREIRFRDFKIPEKEDAAMDVPAHLRIADYSGGRGSRLATVSPVHRHRSILYVHLHSCRREQAHSDCSCIHGPICGGERRS